MATQLGPIDWGVVRTRIARSGVFARPTMHHPQSVDPVAVLQRRGIIGNPTTNHPPGPVTGGNKRRP